MKVRRTALSLPITIFLLSFFAWNRGSDPLIEVQAQDPFKFTRPKTDTGGIKVRKESVAIMPKTVPLLDLRFENIFSVDPAKGRLGRITYTLPEPAFVKIRVLREGTRELFLAAIVDFQYREAGAHTEVWDGRDYWGNPVDYSKTPYLILQWTESVTTDAASPESVPKPVEYKPGQSQKDVVEKTNYPGRHLHTGHPAEYENVPLLTITTPVENDVLSGKVIVKASMDRKRRGMGDKYGYGVRYYIDDQILHEEFYKPESGGQFSYELDTTAFEDGKHLLYVGVCDHNEHVTSYGFEVFIKNRSK